VGRVPPEQRRRVALLIVVGVLGAFGPFGTDMYLPALPQLGAELGATDAETQLTMVGYLLGLGVGQLVWGPLSDRIGRRTPILIGTIGFTVVSIACALAPSVWVLIPIRLVQGLLGAAGVVVGRAVVRDLYSGADLARIFSRLTIVFGLAPIVAPVVGGALLTFTDWRGTFVVLTGLGAALTVATLVWVPETLDPAHRIHGRSTARGEAWRALARSPQFVRYTIVAVVAMTGLFAYITSVSLVLQQEWRLDPTAFSLWFAVNAVGGILGGQAGGWLVRRFPARTMLPVTMLVSVLAAGLVAAAAVLRGPFWLLELGLFLGMAGFMMGSPLSMALTLEPFQRGAGTAAAVLGAAQFTVGSISPVLVAALAGTTTLSMGVTMAVAAVAALVIAALPRARR